MESKDVECFAELIYKRVLVTSLSLPYHKVLKRLSFEIFVSSK